MIAIAQPEPSTQKYWQAEFLALLPQLEAQLRLAFRRLKPEAREEALQEGMVHCLRAFVRLAQQDHPSRASAKSLAYYAARQVRSGRTAATPLNAQDPLSPYAQRRRGLRRLGLDDCVQESREWIEPLLTDRRASVLDQVAARIDVPQWLAQFSRRTRRIARDLAQGLTTSEVAGKYRLSLGRISQLRRELCASWRRFQGEAS